MPIVLNAFPLKIPELELEARQVSYDKETLDGFRAKHASTHSFRRQGDNILIFSADGTFPVSGTPQKISLKENFGIFCSLVKDGLTRHLAGLGRNPSGFNPIELVSAKSEDNLLIPILGDAYPFKVCAKYSINTRTVQGHPCLVILESRRVDPCQTPDSGSSGISGCRSGQDGRTSTLPDGQSDPTDSTQDDRHS